MTFHAIPVRLHVSSPDAQPALFVLCPPALSSPRLAGLVPVVASKLLYVPGVHFTRRQTRVPRPLRRRVEFGSPALRLWTCPHISRLVHPTRCHDQHFITAISGSNA